jgi:hypothetical protein
MIRAVLRPRSLMFAGEDVPATAEGGEAENFSLRPGEVVVVP